jgi:hypothetical protein
VHPWCSLQWGVCAAEQGVVVLNGEELLLEAAYFADEDALLNRMTQMRQASDAFTSYPSTCPAHQPMAPVVPSIREAAVYLWARVAAAQLLQVQGRSLHGCGGGEDSLHAATSLVHSSWAGMQGVLVALHSRMKDKLSEISGGGAPLAIHAPVRMSSTVSG